MSEDLSLLDEPLNQDPWEVYSRNLPMKPCDQENNPDISNPKTDQPMDTGKPQSDMVHSDPLTVIIKDEPLDDDINFHLDSSVVAQCGDTDGGIHGRVTQMDSPVAQLLLKQSPNADDAESNKKKAQEQTSLERKTWRCKWCLFTSTSFQHLQIHMGFHGTDKKALHCPFCEYKTNDPAAMKEHEVLHQHTNPEKVLECSKCSFTTTLPSKFRDHLINVHQVPVPRDLDLKKFNLLWLTTAPMKQDNSNSAQKREKSFSMKLMDLLKMPYNGSSNSNASQKNLNMPASTLLSTAAALAEAMNASDGASTLPMTDIYGFQRPAPVSENEQAMLQQPNTQTYNRNNGNQTQWQRANKNISSEGSSTVTLNTASGCLQSLAQKMHKPCDVDSQSGPYPLTMLRNYNMENPNITAQTFPDFSNSQQFGTSQWTQGSDLNSHMLTGNMSESYDGFLPIQWENQAIQCELIPAPSGSSDVTSTSTQEELCTTNCDYCDISFNDPVLHSVHMGCHSHNDPFVCNICGKDCENKYVFYTHIMRGHHD